MVLLVLVAGWSKTIIPSSWVASYDCNVKVGIEIETLYEIQLIIGQLSLQISKVSFTSKGTSDTISLSLIEWNSEKLIFCFWKDEYKISLKQQIVADGWKSLSRAQHLKQG